MIIWLIGLFFTVSLYFAFIKRRFPSPDNMDDLFKELERELSKEVVVKKIQNQLDDMFLEVWYDRNEDELLTYNPKTKMATLREISYSNVTPKFLKEMGCIRVGRC